MNIELGMTNGMFRPGAAKRSGEMSPGQVVKGTIVEVKDNGEASVQIGDKTVKAELQVPMKAGEQSYFQVQPESTAERVILKPVTLPGNAIPEKTESLLQQLKLPDTPQTREFAAAMRMMTPPQEMNSLVETLDQVLSSDVGKTAKTSEPALNHLMQAVTIAKGRQLPVTETIVRSLQQTVFGTKLPQLLDRLDEQLTKQLNRQSEMQATDKGTTFKPVQQPSSTLSEPPDIVAVFKQAHDAIRLVRQSLEDVQPKQVAIKDSAQAQSSGIEVKQQAEVKPAQVVLPQVQGVTIKSTPLNYAPTITPTPGLNTNDHVETKISNLSPKDQQTNTQVPSETKQAPANFEKTTRQAPIPFVADPRTLTIPSGDAGQVDPETQPMPSSVPPKGVLLQNGLPKTTNHTTEGPTQESLVDIQIPDHEQIKSWFRALGFMHEKQQHRQAFQLTDLEPFPANLNMLNAGESNLKEVMLNLMASTSDDALRELAQQVVDQITGQQLLLTSDKANVNQMTFFMPVIHEGRQDQVTIHVETRSSKRGEWDADNCRVWFDLSMKNIGLTLVDVNIAKKIVQIHVHNDFQGLQDWIEENKPLLEKSMAELNYRLSTFKQLPYPDSESALENSSLKDMIQSPKSSMPTSNPYRNKPYQGVDYKA